MFETHQQIYFIFYQHTEVLYRLCSTTSIIVTLLTLSILCSTVHINPRLLTFLENAARSLQESSVCLQYSLSLYMCFDTTNLWTCTSLSISFLTDWSVFSSWLSCAYSALFKAEYDWTLKSTLNHPSYMNLVLYWFGTVRQIKCMVKLIKYASNKCYVGHLCSTKMM